jgi:hypothetical protein
MSDKLDKAQEVFTDVFYFLSSFTCLVDGRLSNKPRGSTTKSKSYRKTPGCQGVNSDPSS